MKGIKKLSQVLGAIGKRYVVDTQVGSFPNYMCVKDIAAASSTTVLASTVLTTAVQSVTAGITDPDVYRCVQVVGNQAGVYGNVTIYGKDRGGVLLSETILASGTTAGVSNQPFAEIYEISLPIDVGSGDEISVGCVDKLGLYRPIDAQTDVLEVERKATAATEYTIEATSTVSATYGTVAVTTITADDSFKISYLSKYF